MPVRRQTPPPLPTPITVGASQDWDGNDGPWSSFVLQIGTPAQNVKVLISTSGYQSWAVVPEGCTSTDPLDCAKSRGRVFDPLKSNTWTKIYASANGTFELGQQRNLGYSGNGLYGYDSVSLGWQGSGGPSLEQQIVAGIASKDFFLGEFGLDPRPSNFTDFEHPVASYISNLFSRSMIPSLAWGYTAGNQYRLHQVLGSLTLGGYDASRFVTNSVTFPFNQQEARALTVTIQNHEENVAALIDSTIPYLYLPEVVCHRFEQAFGLTWNKTVQAYLVNETLHKVLQAQDATVTFFLGVSANSEPINITLPYAAFDLMASYPLMTNASRYFPLMRAVNATQYTLGRTLLQEAYLIADYERRNFSISQCNWDALGQQDIKSIISPRILSNVSTPGRKASQHRLSNRQIAGVATSISVLVVLSSLLIWWYISIRKSGRRKSPAVEQKAELDTLNNVMNAASDSAEVCGRHLIDGQEWRGHELEGHTVRELAGPDTLQHELAISHVDSNMTEIPA